MNSHVRAEGVRFKEWEGLIWGGGVTKTFVSYFFNCI